MNYKSVSVFHCNSLQSLEIISPSLFTNERQDFCNATEQILAPENTLQHNQALVIPPLQGLRIPWFSSGTLFSPEDKTQPNPSSLSIASSPLVLASCSFQKSHYGSVPQFHSRPSQNDLISKWSSSHLHTVLPEQHFILPCGNHLPSDLYHSVYISLIRLHHSLIWLKSL